MTDTLGDRIKKYEAVSKFKLTPNTPLFIRIDGRAFHTFTRGADKPFSGAIIEGMAYAAQMTAKEMSGFKLAYVQSDEATFMLTDFDTHETQGWFDYELNKIVSISASAFTAHFNRYWTEQFHNCNVDHWPKVAMFDSRVFSVPVEDWPNVFVWRQRDWERNSLQMYARAYFSHKELDKKNSSDIHEMLHNIGYNWAALSPLLKNGTTILKDGSRNYDRHTYDSLRELAGV